MSTSDAVAAMTGVTDRDLDLAYVDMAAPKRPEPVVIDDLADKLETFRLAKAEITKWKNVLEVAQKAIEDRIGEAEVATIGGRPAVLRPHREVTRLDTKRIRADLGDEALSAYLNTTVERRFEVQD